jgi:peptidoglycan/LPS O-acetylase OafA/YrhL
MKSAIRQVALSNIATPRLPKLLHVQMLRAFAALFVVMAHILHEVREMLEVQGLHFND